MARKDVHLWLATWIGMSLTLSFSILVMQTAMARLVGASPEELQELFDTASLPLGWINRSFIIHRESGVLAVCGILIANSYFYSLALFPLIKFVRYRMNRNRTIELGISQRDISSESSPTQPSDDYDL